MGLGRFHTCAANAEGTWCWGSNIYANLGDGSYIDRLTPAPVKYLMRKTLPEPERGYDQVPESSQQQVWPKTLPEGCSLPGSIEFKSKPFKETSFELKTAYAKNHGSYLELTLLNFHGGPSSPELAIYPEHFVRGHQLRMEIELEDGDAPASKPGTYVVGAKKGELKLDEFVIKNSEIQEKIWTTFDGLSAKVDVRHLGANYICGRIEIEHKRAGNYIGTIDIEKVSGDFIADMVNED